MSEKSFSQNPVIRQRCQTHAEALIKDVKGVRAVVISTADGFELASVVQGATQTDRLSAMASSISALGDVMGKESGMGQSKALLLEATNGVMAVLHIRHATQPLTICVSASREAVVGQLLYGARALSTKLEPLLGV